jgi:acetylglutamate kinase
MQDRATILLEALPYIQQFHGKVIVIKLGGSLLEKKRLLESMLRDVVMLNFVGIKTVLVHGGGPEITREMRKLGKQPEFVGGLRVTDKETMEILHKHLVGKINKEMVLNISKHGGRAVGISGMDGNFIMAKKMEHVVAREGQEVEVDLGLVGEVEKINPTVVNYLVGSGYVPVIAPVGIDAEGRSLNLNADTVAAEVASVMHAKKFILLTNVLGVLRDPKDEKTLISKLTIEEARKLIQEGVVKKGMIPKVEACVKAVESGVERAHIIKGSEPHALLLEILTESGVGTMIERGK